MLMETTSIYTDQRYDLFKRACPVQNEEMMKDVEKHLPKGKKIVAILTSSTIGMRMFSFVIKGEKSNAEITKKGYYLAYVYNADVPDFSELGEIYIELNSEGKPYRTA